MVFGAVSDDAEALKGQYFSMCKVREVSDYALSDEGWSMERRFWVRKFQAVIAVR